MGWKILLPQEIMAEGRKLLEDAGHELIMGRGFETEDVLEDMKKYQPDAMIVRITPITREVIEANPNLKVIVRHGAGFDTVDLKACEDNNVQTLYAPVANSTSVAETALLLMFRVAVRALALEMNVLAYDPYKPAKDFPDGVEVVRDLNRIFTECDYVSLHAPSTPVTKNMINKETLAMMKPTAILINTARGALVVEEDLYEACKNGVITAAGLDAIRQEPVDPKNPLLTLDNVIIYPHIGGNTAEAAHRASYFSAMGIQEVYEGKKPTWPINNIDYTTAKTYDDVKKPNKKPAGMFDF